MNLEEEKKLIDLKNPMQLIRTLAALSTKISNLQSRLDEFQQLRVYARERLTKLLLEERLLNE